MAGEIDLHVHTTCSDGNLTPTEVVKAAKNAGLKAIAISDHDTTEGFFEAVSQGRQSGVEVILGVEFGCRDGNIKGSLHILGYLFDIDHPELNQELLKIRDSRLKRNLKMVEVFNTLGVSMTYEGVAQFSQGKIVGRPHFAQFLVANQIVPTIDAAFEIYLAKGKKAYQPKEYQLSPIAAIQLITKAGGISVLAHPKFIEIPAAEKERYIQTLKEQGLHGLEVYYSDFDEAEIEYYAGLAKRYGLFMTGGSDYHGGRIKEGVFLGKGTGNLQIAYELLRLLKVFHQRTKTGLVA